MQVCAVLSQQLTLSDTLINDRCFNHHTVSKDKNAPKLIEYCASVTLESRFSAALVSPFMTIDWFKGYLTTSSLKHAIPVQMVTRAVSNVMHKQFSHQKQLFLCLMRICVQNVILINQPPLATKLRNGNTRYFYISQPVLSRETHLYKHVVRYHYIHQQIPPVVTCRYYRPF